MKQLKFFTSRADTLRATECALKKSGITRKRLHVFTRENTQNRYDGLILASQHREDQDALTGDVTILVSTMLVGSVGVYYDILNFTTFGLFCIAVSVLPFLRRWLSSRSSLSDSHINKVYFLVVDVDDKEAQEVTSILESQSGLVTQ